MQLVATVSGTVDTIVIDKLTRRFAHTAAGSFLTDVDDVMTFIERNQADLDQAIERLMGPAQ